MDTRLTPALLCQDAALLVRQYQSFGQRGAAGLSLDQRRAWAEEMVQVMEQLLAFAAPLANAQSPLSTTDICVEWNRQMKEGQRIATVKLSAENAAYIARIRDEANAAVSESKKSASRSADGLAAKHSAASPKT